MTTSLPKKNRDISTVYDNGATNRMQTRSIALTTNSDPGNFIISIERSGLAAMSILGMIPGKVNVTCCTKGGSGMSCNLNRIFPLSPRIST